MTLFQARLALIGLKFEAKTGMKMSSKVNTKKLVAEALGLPVKTKYPVLIAALEQSIKNTEEGIAKGEIVAES